MLVACCIACSVLLGACLQRISGMGLGPGCWPGVVASDGRCGRHRHDEYSGCHQCEHHRADRVARHRLETVGAARANHGGRLNSWGFAGA